MESELTQAISGHDSRDVRIQFGADDRSKKERSASASRMAKYLSLAAARADSISPQMANCLRICKPLVVLLVKVIEVVAPVYGFLYMSVYHILARLPSNTLKIVFGLALCFFGGVYQTSIAAIEAFRNLGGQSFWVDLEYLRKQALSVQLANEVDDQVDDDHNGIADVDEMAGSALMEHKMKMAMIAVDDPTKLQDALGHLCSAYLAVLATLRFEFARTTALALGVAGMCKFPALRVSAPALAWLLGPELQHWVETIIDTSISFIAIVFAWYVQAMISAVYTGLRGGHMVADGLFSLLTERGLMERLPDRLVAKPFNPDESYLDEAIAYSLAVIGVYFQVSHGFILAFPLNIIFLPLTLLEWWLRFQISWGSVANTA